MYVTARVKIAPIPVVLVLSIVERVRRIAVNAPCTL
jgi:hypothetical protein